ncbi:MAG: hypothetical protein B7Y41_02135 [Hydrogenophilales bacterium 28-61-23]|nr:MAG: hypothetical protein B7Y41_02135 [Hydrogenophilales bacterium 28-61-23]
MHFLKNAIIGLLLSTVLTPLIVWTGVASPFVFPKAVFSRSFIEIALIGAFIYAAFTLSARPVEAVRSLEARLRQLAQNPLLWALVLYFVSLVVSTFLATDRFWAFWGPIERSEGLWGMLHFLVFIVLGSIFFERKHWLLFFKLSLGVGLVVVARACVEYFGLFGMTPNDRPYSFMGNPAFLATQMLFLIAFSALVFIENNKFDSTGGEQRFWRYASPLLALLFFAAILLAKTRGVFLGVAAGAVVLLLYFVFQKHDGKLTASGQADGGVQPSHFRSGHVSARTASLLALGFLSLCAAVLFLTRDAPVWQSIPGLDRLVRTSLFDQQDASTQLRLNLWGLSWEAFKARPIFGWGPENYIVAFERHYDPNLAIHGELWFDRAHNKLIDVLVTQGAFGLFAYLAIFGAALFHIVKLKQGPKALLIALLAAYFVQNLVFIDNLISYLFFFAVLGYIFRLWRDETKSNDDARRPPMPTVPPITYLRPAYILMTGAMLSVPLVFSSLYLWNWVPFNQARLYFAAAVENSVDGMVSTLAGAMAPYSFVQAGIRTSAIDETYLPEFFYDDAVRLNPQHVPLGEILLKGMQEIIQRHPVYEARYYTRLVEMMNGYARSDTTYYAKAEPIIRSALEIAPTHQELLYHLAFNLAGQGRFDESIQVSQQAVDLSPTVLSAHVKLGFMYAMAGQRVKAQREIKLMEGLDPALKTLSEHDRDTLRYLYKSWGMSEKRADGEH